jgi:hypothetical protein
LKGRYLGPLAANADFGAAFAFCRLLTLKTKHGISSLMIGYSDDAHDQLNRWMLLNIRVHG